LSFEVWKWSCHQLSTPRQMGKHNGSIKSWNNIYAQPIILMLIGYNFWPWQSLPIQHNAFINLANTSFCKSWFAPKVWQSRSEQNLEFNS
jgi:hypothetical protein